MSDYEDVYMQCPFCGEQIMKSATDAEIAKWLDAHIRNPQHREEAT